MSESKTPPPTMRWIGDPETGSLELIDQTRLPTETVMRRCDDVESVWEAIKMLRVRGAPAIGCAAAYGVVIGARGGAKDGGGAAVVDAADAAADHLATSRPTAVNLFWALERMRKLGATLRDGDRGATLQRLLGEASAIEAEDAATCRAIGAAGAALVPEGASILTHCNAGGLATAAYGTALGVIYAAHEEGKVERVFADETRPLLQGARLTAWELQRAGIDVSVLPDAAAATVLRRGMVDLVVVGADRIARNGDVANKIGTYPLAVLAREHGVPFYVAAPISTFDPDCPNGDAIPIEERAADEVHAFGGVRTAPEGVGSFNPAFDVTPARLVTAIVTQHGLIRDPDEAKVTAHLAAAGVAID